jgi:SAM-dependent methyltransferase
MPFPDASFASIMSISVMEHIPGVADVLREEARVLRPGGLLAYTVPIDAYGSNHIGARVLRPLSKGLSAAYGTFVSRLMEIENDWPMQRWRDLTEEAGLVVEQCTAILSPAATMATEALLPAAYASRLYRKAFGRRPPRPAPLLPLLESMLKPWVEDDRPGGSNILVVARKPA